MKEIRKTVDNHLPKWLHSRILTAVDFIWQVKGDEEKTQARISAVAEKLDGEQMSWVMMLLTLPKLQTIIMNSDDAMEFIKKKNKERTVH
jgi:hypothetical protein